MSVISKQLIKGVTKIAFVFVKMINPIFLGWNAHLVLLCIIMDLWDNICHSAALVIFQFGYLLW